VLERKQQTSNKDAPEEADEFVRIRGPAAVADVAVGADQIERLLVGAVGLVKRTAGIK
jgi:hypothetical protein